MANKHYPQEFRDEVVAVARRSDGTLKQIASDFGVSESSLKLWMKKADDRDGIRASDDKESRELKKRIRLLEQENEILRRAAAYFSQASLPKK